MSRALMATRLILSSGTDGIHWDKCRCEGGSDFGPNGIARFGLWLERNFDAPARNELFGTVNLDELTPGRALPPRKNKK
jgi:hypothetical protein